MAGHAFEEAWDERGEVLVLMHATAAIRLGGVDKGAIALA
jgi:hypothetical protein